MEGAKAEGRDMTRIFAPAASTLRPVAVTYDVERKSWVLLEGYALFDRARDTILSIPAGFEFDLASIPRPLWWRVGPFELSIVAPLCHDFLYRHGGRCPEGTVRPYREYTRAEADSLFRDLMEEEGVGKVRRNLAYAAVRAFGGIRAWRTQPPAVDKAA